MSNQSSIIGVGSPVVDILARVPEDFLKVIGGAKGGMELVDATTMNGWISHLPGESTRMPGGSAGNTIFATAALGGRTSFFGKLGNDEYGEFFRSSLESAGGDTNRFIRGEGPNARCLSLITPDSERTMRTDLGVAMTLAPDEVTIDAFRGMEFAHIEGYILFNPELAAKTFECAKAAGCRISVDLAAFEVVEASRSILNKLLKENVEMIFANEAEAGAFFQEDPSPRDHARRLREYCPIAVVKEGRHGSWIAGGDDVVHVDAVPGIEAVDTTGAGDFWAGGFLYGMMRGWPLEQCGWLGSLLGAEVVQQVGARLPDTRWKYLREQVSRRNGS